MNESIACIGPGQAALLAMDYQTAILSGLSNAGELVARIADTIRTARSSGVLIAYVWVAFDDSDYAAIPNSNRGFSEAAVARRLYVESPESSIHPALAPEPGDVVVRKTRVGAFSTTDLDRQLRERNIDTLILAGISTSGVVLSTIRDAADRDYRLYVLDDGCADPDEETHTLLIRKVFPRQASVIKTGDLSHLLGGA
jgi:nicotinamidase-related amidase